MIRTGDLYSTDPEENSRASTTGEDGTKCSGPPPPKELRGLGRIEDGGRGEERGGRGDAFFRVKGDLSSGIPRKKKKENQVPSSSLSLLKGRRRGTASGVVCHTKVLRNEVRPRFPGKGRGLVIVNELSNRSIITIRSYDVRPVKPP